MGSFVGHLLPGVIFILYGLCWILFSFWLHLTTSTSRTTKGRHSSSSSVNGGGSSSYSDYKREVKLGRLSYLPQPFCERIPMEPVFKVVLSSIGLMIEAFVGDDQHGKQIFQVMEVFHPDGSLHSVSKVHHVTMYGAFLVSGLVDLIGSIIRIPRNFTKVFFSLCFFIEAVLFWFHTHDKEHLNIAVHSLLILAIFASFLISLLRIIQQSNVIINSFLGVSILLQGTWFVHAGSILYRETTWVTMGSNSEAMIMFTVVLFSWHIMGDAFFALILYVLVAAVVKGSLKYRKHRRGDQSNKWAWPTLPLHRDKVVSNDEESKQLINDTLATRDTLL